MKRLFINNQSYQDNGYGPFIKSGGKMKSDLSSIFGTGYPEHLLGYMLHVDYYSGPCLH